MSFCLLSLSPQFNDPSPLSGMKLTSGNRWFQQQAKSALLSLVSLCSLSAIVRGMASSTPIQSGFIIRFFLPFGEVVHGLDDAECARRGSARPQQARNNGDMVTRCTTQRRGRSRSAEESVHFPRTCKVQAEAIAAFKISGMIMVPKPSYLVYQGYGILYLLVASDFTVFTRILRERPKAINK